MDIFGHSEKKCFTFMWFIENFSYCWQKKGKSIASPAFIVSDLAKTKWTLQLFPKGDKEIEEDFISFCLQREGDSKGTKNYKIFYELSFLAVDGSVLVSTGIMQEFVHKGHYTDPDNFVKREEVLQIRRQEFLPGNILTARCRMWNGILRDTKEVYCSARTRIVVERMSFPCKINQFSSFQNSIHTIRSFSEGHSIITIHFFLGGGQNNDTSIYAIIRHNDEKVKFSSFCLHFVDIARIREKCLSVDFTFHEDFETESFKLTLSKEELLNNRLLYLPNDVLTLYCECAFTTGTVSEEIENISYGCPLSFHERNLASDDLGSKVTLDSTRILKENLETSYEENLLCDIKLKTKTGTFPANKFILSARSPVFKAMFTNDMKERNTECVYIEDLNDDTVRRMLLYIYTSTVQDLQWESASHLYTAANKYEILSLKNKCSSFLKDNLCPDNACDLLIFADMHQNHDLKSTAQDYIWNHKGLFGTNECKLFMETNLHLAADLMLGMLN